MKGVGEGRQESGGEKEEAEGNRKYSQERK